MLASTTLRLTFLTRNPSIGCTRQYGTGRSQPGHGISLFQTDLDDASRISKVRANMRRCAAVVILRRA